MVRIQDLIRSFRRGNNQYTKTNPLYYLNQLFNNNKEIWVTINDQEFELYRTTPQLQTVINRDAKMLATGRFKLYNSKGEEVEKHPVLDLLKNPNPLQSTTEFLIDYQIQKNIYGNQFMLMNKGNFNSIPKTLVNLPTYGMTIKKTGKYYRQLTVDGIIESYVLEKTNTEKETFLPSEIIHSRISNPNDAIIGLSPLHGLTMPISNLRGAYGFRNRIILKNGALGILSSSSKDQSGGIPLSESERERIEKQYVNDYGIGDEQRSILMTSSPLSWQSMTHPTKDLMLFDEVNADFLAIIDAYGHNENIYSTKNSAKFQNMNEALRQVYQDRVKPEASALCLNFTERFGLLKQGLFLDLDYSHLEILKEDDLLKAKTQKTKADAIQSLLNSGAYTLEEIKNIITL
jgi:HK97 family phage portal protein